MNIDARRLGCTGGPHPLLAVIFILHGESRSHSPNGRLEFRNGRALSQHPAIVYFYVMLTLARVSLLLLLSLSSPPRPFLPCLLSERWPCDSHLNSRNELEFRPE
jgi:hypothetical protein